MEDEHTTRLPHSCFKPGVTLINCSPVLIPGACLTSRYFSAHIFSPSFLKLFSFCLALMSQVSQSHSGYTSYLSHSLLFARLTFLHALTLLTHHTLFFFLHFFFLFLSLLLFLTLIFIVSIEYKRCSLLYLAVFSTQEKNPEPESWLDIRPVSAALRMQVRRRPLVHVVITASRDIKPFVVMFWCLLLQNDIRWFMSWLLASVFSGFCIAGL